MKRRKPTEPTADEWAAALDLARAGNPAPAIALGANPYAVRLLDPAFRAERDRKQAERAAAWGKTPRKLFGHDTAAAKAAGWRFERDGRRYYAISPTGYRFRWNGCMMHGGADPWEPVGPVVTGSVGKLC